jgi:hypothetical protein
MDYIVGMKYNGDGIDWYRDAVPIESNQHIKDAENEAGPECDAIIRQQGIMPYRAWKVPYYGKLEIRIRFIRKI